MTDVNKVIDNPDTSSPRPADREVELAHWSPADGQRTAESLGITMSDDHWRVIEILRAHYLEQGMPTSGRDLSDHLDAAFAEQGGRRHLRRLFPQGPVLQGLKIAGLPIPPYTEDEGFGVAR
ncbi:MULTISPECIES: TusE/DsrC/DsvC family sulfur relay protein [Thiorhodovibrio]|jgi:tRNA 2-thiouridine synthesizing protein E|uniref:TusE/DsrC/DsvC family sulfur relay protein n=1 Tax=Thiorhodovibrio TaxID=61593 RepID=UPI001913E4C7|nr:MULTISPECIES: TusE/DsrC/DsvC family sulfur relay protein [Thiorhodovibrio]WPL13427.1 Sulfurtransferase TusE [Thiorhodovibrio litoralis]